jgi:hypothetical protein
LSQRDKEATYEIGGGKTRNVIPSEAGDDQRNGLSRSGCGCSNKSKYKAVKRKKKARKSRAPDIVSPTDAQQFYANGEHQNAIHFPMCQCQFFAFRQAPTPSLRAKGIHNRCDWLFLIPIGVGHFRLVPNWGIGGRQGGVAPILVLDNL